MAKRLRTLHRRSRRRASQWAEKSIRRLVKCLGVEGASLFMDLFEANTPAQEIVSRVRPFARAERQRKAALNG
jgi:hypothetical protein